MNRKTKHEFVDTTPNCISGSLLGIEEPSHSVHSDQTNTPAKISASDPYVATFEAIKSLTIEPK